MRIWKNFNSVAIAYLIQVAYFKNFQFSNGSCDYFFANTKGIGTSFQAAVLLASFSFVIWQKLAKCHWQTVFASQVIQWNVFLVLCLGIWWRHEIWKCRILKFDYLENKKSFWSKIKNTFPSLTTALV